MLDRITTETRAGVSHDLYIPVPGARLQRARPTVPGPGGWVDVDRQGRLLGTMLMAPARGPGPLEPTEA